MLTDIKTARTPIVKVSIMGLFIAVVSLWVTFAIAGMNEDLVEAAKIGDLPEVKRLLAKGADGNAKDELRKNT